MGSHFGILPSIRRPPIGTLKVCFLCLVASVPACLVLAPDSSSKLQRAEVAVVNPLTVQSHHAHAGADDFSVDAGNLVWPSCNHSTLHNNAALKQGIGGIGIPVEKPLEAAQAGRHGQGRG